MECGACARLLRRRNARQGWGNSKLKAESRMEWSDIDRSAATALKGSGRGAGSKQKGNEVLVHRAWTSACKVPRASYRWGFPRDRGLPSLPDQWARACAAPRAPRPLRTESPRSRKCPAASTAPGNAGFQARQTNGHAHAPRLRCGLEVRAPEKCPAAAQRATGILPVGISPGPRASKPAGRRAGAWAAPCSTPPLRTESPRSGEMPSREHRPRERGLPSPQAEGHAHAPHLAPRACCGLKVRAPEKCPAASTAPGNAGFQARKPKGRCMGRAMLYASAAD